MANNTRRASRVYSATKLTVTQTTGAPLTDAQAAAVEELERKNRLTPNVQAKLFDNVAGVAFESKLGKCRLFRIGKSEGCSLRFENAPLMPDVVATGRLVDGEWRLVVNDDGLRVKVNGAFLRRGDEVALKRGGGDVNVVEMTTFAEKKPLFQVFLNFPASEDEAVAERVERLDDKSTRFAGEVHQEVIKREAGLLSRIKKLLDSDDKTDGIDEAERKWIESEGVELAETTIEEVAQDFDLYDDEEERKELMLFMAGQSIKDQILANLLGVETYSHRDDDDFLKIFHSKLKDFGSFRSASPAYEERLSGRAARYEGYVKISAPPEKPAQFDFKDYDLYLRAYHAYLDKYGAWLNDALEKVEKGFWKEWFARVDGYDKHDREFCQYLARRYLTKTVKDVIFGYGPLEDILRTSVVTEIMVVDYKTIYVEMNGRIEKSGRRFFDESKTVDVIKRIVACVNRQIDRSTPLVDARLSDGSRVNAIVDPIAVSGACLTIRRFPQQRLTIKELVENPRIRSLTQSAAQFLRASILARKNILVSGGTGTGKTTLLNCLCDYIPDGERIVTIEDTAELRIAKRHVVRLESKLANAEQTREYTIRDLVRNALRMRPDRIIVGECRGGEALDMLQAMNTGHDGSLTTIHANGAEDAILRLETLVLQSDAKMPIASIDRQIVSAIDLIVQLKRMRSGRRCVSQIVEVTGLDPETGEFVTRELFNLDSETDDGAVLRPTGSLPSYMDVLLARGWLDLEKFYFDGQEAR